MVNYAQHRRANEARQFKAIAKTLAFTPSSSGLYWLSADDSSADVQLFSFSPSGQLVDINSYISDPNLQQEYYLDSENTYYIAVQGHNGDAITTTVFISSTYY